MSEAARSLTLFRLGRIDYASGLRLQHALVEARLKQQVGDLLLLLEHEPVITVGRSPRSEPIVGAPFPVVEIERGGEATFHGPGQLVGYPIVLLGDAERDLHRYLRQLEELLIRTVAALGYQARRHPPHTGVWVGERKVASIGVAVRRWVTYHGFALNVTTDLSAFRSFRPCGLPAEVMSSLAELGGNPISRTDVEAQLLEQAGPVLDRSVQSGQLEDLRARFPELLRE